MGIQSVTNNMSIGRVGGNMSHSMNNQILEDLFTKWYDVIQNSFSFGNINEETVSLLAEQAAKAEFENMVGPHG